MKTIYSILLLTIFYLTASREVNAQTYTWNQVRIGGSGALPSFVAHPKVPDLYFITTDVGTPYRWNKNLQKWEHLMLFKKIPVTYWNWEFHQRCGSIAVDPSDSTGNILYATVQDSEGAGPGKGKSDLGTILKSTDRGDTWTDLHVPIRVYPNSTQQFGDRIQVDPSNSNRVWVVTDQNGALKSDNAGASWSQVSDVTTQGYCSFILFDKSSGTVAIDGQPVTRRIYIGRSNGVYASENGGSSFALMSNSPAYPYRATIHADGTLYVSAGAENLPKGVYKYKSGGWQNISPVTLEPDPDPNKSDRYFSKVAVDPANSNEILVGTRGTWNKDPYFVSTQGGAPGSYTQGKISRDNSEAPHSRNDGVSYNAPGHNPIAFTWDPFYPNRVWTNDLLDILCTDNVFAATANWKIRVVGLEEIMVTGPLMAPPSGKNQLLSVTADVGGAHHRSLTEPLYTGAVSNTALYTNIFSAFNMQGVAYQYTDPNFIVRVGSDGPDNNDIGASRAGYSTDGGDTYTLFPTLPGIRGRVAVSANRRNILWLTQMDGNSPGNVYWSDNLGGNWTKSTGLASGILPAGPQWVLYPGENHLVADKVNGDYFYVWDRGSFFVSSDGGKSFVKTAAEGLTANAGNNSNGSAYATTSNVEATPGKTGDVWIAYYNDTYPEYSALYHTTDTGRTFTRVGGENFKPKWIAAAMSDTTPNAHLALYATSQILPINGVYYGAFRSDDTGRTWTTILDRLPGVAPNIAADNKGRMFISAHGNGIFFGTPVAGPVQSVEIINASSDTIVKGYSLKLNVKLTPAYPTNPAVTWSSSDTSVAKVDPFGNVNAIKAGNATITVTSVDGGKTDTHTIVVIPPTISTGITIDSIVYGTMNTPKQIMATITPANTTNKTLIWTVADGSVASVDANGVIKGLKLDTTMLTVTAADGGASRTVRLIVNTIVTAINAGTTGNPATPYQNTTIGQYVPEGPSGTAGLWHAGYTGNVRITATADLSQVTEPAPRQVYEYMRISRNNVTQMRYYLRNLIPNANYAVRLHFIEPSDADKANRIFSVKAANGDSLVNFNVYQAAGNKLNTVVTRTIQAKANSSGLIEVWFYPKTGAGDLYSASIAAIEARIIPLQGISIQSDSSNLYVSYTDTLKLGTTPLNATNRNVSYLSSNPAVATVDLNGVVTGKSAGTVSITATSAESGFTATKTYNVIYVPVQSLTLNTSSADVFVGLTTQLTASIAPAKASNKQVVWTSSDTMLAKVNSSGTITGIKQGDVIIKAASAENPAIFAQANVHVVNVLATGLTLQPSSAIIGARDTLLMKYTFSPANTTGKNVSWTSSDATVASVDTAGIITAIRQGTATITASALDGSNVSATLPVTIVPFDSCGGIPNYGFESDLINWLTFKKDSPFVGAVYTVSGKGHSGDKAVTMGFTTVKTSMNIQGSIPVRGGSVIVFSKWVKVEKDATGYPWWAGYGVGFVDNQGNSTGNANYSKELHNVAAYRDNWAQVRDTITVPDSATGLTYWVAKEGFGTVWLDDYCIEVLKTNQNAVFGINAGTTLTPPGPYANTIFAQYVPEGPTGTDKLWHAGYTWVQKVNAPVDLSQVTDPAPPQVYEYVRVFKDNVTQMRYYLRGLAPNTVYTIRLHFVEPQDAEKNKRIFSIKATNGLDSLTDFNIYQAAGNKLNTAVIKTIRAKADNAGLIMVFFYPKKGLYDPYSGSVAAIEVRTLQPGDTLQNVTANQSLVAVAGNKLNTHGKLDFTTEIYPNPSDGVFNVRMTSSAKAPAVLSIVNNVGSVVYSARINAGVNYQLGGQLQPGIYYINIRQGTQSKTMKVVKH
ncbi:Ig-like domain-containing protein [Chitinophaga filiformis]|uniref:Ig-like domain-containing protein n=1 Tax=Chitinophaga filiformis TaxID=104663 RepID=A0ABY4HVK1_CHIFI|nr:Ig-like domain-containing protein [Chitinophaga filiformis]UPK67819.1 Ig-like domain-containing protein [Chitinophaga filiformis]